MTNENNVKKQNMQDANQVNINKNLTDFLLGSPESVDESEVMTEGQQVLYQLYSPTDIQRAKEMALNINRHDLYDIMLGSSGVDPLQKNKTVTPLSRDEKLQILKKIEIANIFLDYAKNDTQKDEMIKLAASKEMTSSDLSLRLSQHISGSVPKSELDGFKDKLQNMMVAAEKEGMKQAKKDSYDSYRRSYHPGRKLVGRTILMAGALAFASVAYTTLKNFHNENNMRQYYNHAKPAIERSILKENGLDDSRVQEKPLKDLTFREYVRETLKKDTLDNAVKSENADSTSLGTVNPKDTTKTVATQAIDSSKYKTIAPVARVIPKDNIADSLKKSLNEKDFMKLLSSQIGADYVLIVKPSGALNETYRYLPKNSAAEKTLNDIKSMEISGETFTVLVDTAKLNKKLDRLKSFGLQHLSDASGLAALDELVWQSYHNMGDVPLSNVSNYIDLYINSFGSTSNFHIIDLKQLIEHKTVIEQWSKSAAKDIDNNIIRWLDGLSKQNNKLGRDASYISANICTQNNTIYDRNGVEKLFLTLPKLRDNETYASKTLDHSYNILQNLGIFNLSAVELDPIITYLSRSARGDSLSVSRAMFTFARFVADKSTPENSTANKAALNHAVASLMYGGFKTAWAPNALYVIADMVEKLGNRNTAIYTINLMNKLFPNNENTVLTVKLKGKIEDYYRADLAKKAAAQESNYKNTKYKVTQKN